jgi:hypothetical protein
VQLLEEGATAEAIVDSLSDAGVEPEEIGDLLAAVRACLAFADSLPESTEELDADELGDFLIDEGVEPDLVPDVVDAFLSLGEEA